MYEPVRPKSIKPRHIEMKNMQIFLSLQAK